jgi:hypothetical protein
MADLEAIRQAMSRSEQELLRDWYDHQMQEQFGSPAADLLGAEGDLGRSFVEWLRQMDVRRLICEEWGYCARRLRYEEASVLAAALADLLAVYANFAPASTVVVLFVKFVGNRFCRCEQPPR